MDEKSRNPVSAQQVPPFNYWHSKCNFQGWSQMKPLCCLWRFAQAGLILLQCFIPCGKASNNDYASIWCPDKISWGLHCRTSVSTMPLVNKSCEKQNKDLKSWNKQKAFLYWWLKNSLSEVLTTPKACTWKNSQRVYCVITFRLCSLCECKLDPEQMVCRYRAFSYIQVWQSFSKKM